LLLLLLLVPLLLLLVLAISLIPAVLRVQDLGLLLGLLGLLWMPL
jgi:hypothetical protein